uniref:Uncharacterized protein n=1 Tax=Tetranychus urticae TaxID=32264 RepID=T1KZJ3_TETUR
MPNNGTGGASKLLTTSTTCAVIQQQIRIYIYRSSSVYPLAKTIIILPLCSYVSSPYREKPMLFTLSIVS